MDDYLRTRSDRALTSFAKGLASVLRNPAKAKAIMESGTPGGDLVAAKVNANRRGRAFRGSGRAPNFREVNYMRGLKSNEVFRANARVAGSPEGAQLRAARGLGTSVGTPVLDSRRAAIAARERRNTRGWGSWPKTPPRGGRDNTFNPRSRG